MINIQLLRALGDPKAKVTHEQLQEACLQAAATIEELCEHIDGCVSVAVDAIKRARK